MADEENKAEAGPEETKVGCLNTCSRWIGCCDITGYGDDGPNLREGVLKKRACTDCPWIIILASFTAFCIGVIWAPLLADTDLDRFRGGSDYLKNTCGVGDYEDRPYAAWPDLMVFDVKICVASCDQTQESTFGASYAAVSGVSYAYTIIGYESAPQVFWCVPEFDGDIYDAWYANYQDYQVVRWINDLYNNYQIPLYALPFTFAFLFAYFVFVRCFLKCLIRILFFAILIATFVSAYSFMEPGLEADEESYYVGVGILVVGISFWCLMCCCWNQLMEVCDVMKKASEALIVMPLVNAVPLMTFPFVCGIVFLWFFLTSLMFSKGEKEKIVMPSSPFITSALAAYYPGEETAFYEETVYDTTIQHMFFVHLFWMLWSLVFIEYFNFVVISTCVADWFLDKELVDNPNMETEYTNGCCGGNCMRIFRAIYRTLRYHLGTIAFASCLIAVIQTIEFIIMYAQKQIGDSDNPFAKTVLKILLAVVKCFECIINRCNKNTLVVTAVLGSPFCGGCGHSLSLLFKNMSLMGLGTTMIVLLTYIANTIIAMFSAGIGMYIHLGSTTTLDDIEKEYESLFLPAVTGFVLSFLIAKILLSVWDASATTILVCHAMCHEYYPNEFGKHLGSKSGKADKYEIENQIELAAEPQP